jgi:peptidoglycan/xylan/chitin deacetylase (PgdA/CDA1 family)
MNPSASSSLLASSLASINVRQLVRLGMATTLPRRLFMVSGPKASRAVTLTFDDGPHPEHTPLLLDRLKARGIRATFFLLGAQAERHPDIVRRIAAEGHDVGHHSYTHGDPETTSWSMLADEARRAAKLMETLVGRSPHLFRPPHGKITASKALALWTLRQTIVLWNQDPKDFSCGSAEVLRAWFAGRRLEAGDVILLHDVHPYAADALDAMVDRATAAGLGFCRVSDWVSA